MVAVPPEAATPAVPAPPDVVEAPDPGEDVEAVFVLPDAEPDPADGEEHVDRVDLVRTGLVRVWIGGTRFRLRRPFFGEFRQLRTSLQDVNDEISEASDEALRVARQISDEAKASGATDLDPDAWVAWRRDARKRSNDTSRTLATLAEDSRLQWWNTTWEMLTVDGNPATDWPSWVVDPALLAALVEHWRRSPQGRG